MSECPWAERSQRQAAPRRLTRRQRLKGLPASWAMSRDVLVRECPRACGSEVIGGARGCEAGGGGAPQSKQRCSARSLLWTVRCHSSRGSGALGTAEPRPRLPDTSARVLTASRPRRHKRAELEPHVSDELGAGGSPADLEAGLCSPRRGGRRGRASVWETCGTMRLRFLLQGHGGLDLPPWVGCRVEAEFWAASRPGRGGWRQQGRQG